MPDDATPPTDQQPRSAASLTAGVLAEEAARHDAHDTIPEERLGANEESMSLKEGLGAGGTMTFVILLILNSLDELEAAALTVLGPDIGETLGVSDGTMVFMTVAASSFFVLGAVPMGYLADRYKRPPIIGISSLIFAAMVFMSGLALNAFMLFWARFGVGISKANTIPVHGSLIADTYPIGVRGRLGATNAMAGRIVAAVSPLLVGTIATVAGGVENEGWRWAFYILGVPVAIAALSAFKLKEPPRGQWEKKDILGAVEQTDIPISMEAGFARLWQIKTLKAVVVAFSALGFMIFPAASLENFYLEERFGLDAFGRGLVSFASAGLALALLPYAGRRFDSLFKEDPAKALRMVGLLLFPVAVVTPVMLFMPHPALFAAVKTLNVAATSISFAMVGPLLQQVVPYRLRGLGQAMGTLYIFLIGALGGALLSGLLVGSFGERTTIIVLSVPASLIGATVLINSSRGIRHDISMVVADIRQDQEEAERAHANPDDIPALQLSNIDFSYGQVQVLFDVNFSVKQGETLALLGTNGAGKSTALKVAAGLGVPSRGAVRLNGLNVTFTTPEQHADRGIQMLPGGKGVFGSMSIAENLEMGAYLLRDDKANQKERIDKALDLFPALHNRLGERAGDLSGGQQQQLALARVLLFEPEVLIIDELSLGLAPVIVQELLEILERIKEERQQTMVIVEQSLNVALAIADRAVFMEKGQVRFEGPAAELAERDDLARAVFLGGEGG